MKLKNSALNSSSSDVNRFSHRGGLGNTKIGVGPMSMYARLF